MEKQKRRIPDKDQNILWGRAAALCSMPNCKKKLIYEANYAISSSATKIGENCHILGENEGSALSIHLLVHKVDII